MWSTKLLGFVCEYRHGLLKSCDLFKGTTDFNMSLSQKIFHVCYVCLFIWLVFISQEPCVNITAMHEGILLVWFDQS